MTSDSSIQTDETATQGGEQKDLMVLLQHYWRLRKASVSDLGELVRLEAFLAGKSFCALLVGLLCLGVFGSAAWFSLQLLLGLGVMSMGFSLPIALLTVFMGNGVMLWMVAREMPSLLENMGFPNVRRMLRTSVDGDA